MKVRPGPSEAAGTAPRPRPGVQGVVAGLLYGAIGVAWVGLTRPSGPVPVYLGLLVLLVILGTFLPGVANQVTASRAYLAVPGFVYALDARTLGLLATVVALAGLTDLADGTIARRFDRPSPLGGALDPVVDGLFFGAVAVGLFEGGAYPAWLAAVVVGRYALPALAGAALIAGGRSPRLRHTLMGQVSTVLIAVLLGWIALFRALGQDASQVVRGAEVALPLAALATFFNLYLVNRDSMEPRGG